MRQTSLGLFALAVVSLMADAGPAGAGASGAARRGIQAALAARNTARQRRDLAAYMATFTPDWVRVNVAGRAVDAATLRRSMAAGFARATGTGVSHSDITRCTAGGDAAQVTVSTHFDFPADKARSGTVYPYRDTVASETWVHGPAGWQEKRERYLVDTAGVSAAPVPYSKREGPRP